MQRPWGRNMPDLFKGEKAATVVGAGGVRSNDVRGRQMPDYEASGRSLEFILIVMEAIGSL